MLEPATHARLGAAPRVTRVRLQRVQVGRVHRQPIGRVEAQPGSLASHTRTRRRTGTRAAAAKPRRARRPCQPCQPPPPPPPPTNPSSSRRAAHVLGATSEVDRAGLLQARLGFLGPKQLLGQSQFTARPWSHAHVPMSSSSNDDRSVSNAAKNLLCFMKTRWRWQWRCNATTVMSLPSPRTNNSSFSLELNTVHYWSQFSQQIYLFCGVALPAQYCQRCVLSHGREVK